MKKTFGIISLFVVIVLSLSAHTARVVDAVPGQKAPEITFHTNELDNRPRTFSIGDLTNEGYVLINFWETADAASRVCAGEYDRKVRELPQGILTLISLNFDENEPLFREVVKLDGLNEAQQYRLQGDSAHVVSTLYHLEQGYRAVLINPQGKIVAVDPSPEALESLVRG